MSIAAISWAKRQKAGGVAAKAVLLVLADYADERGWVSLKVDICGETEATAQEVRKALNDLSHLGLIADVVDGYVLPCGQSELPKKTPSIQRSVRQALLREAEYKCSACGSQDRLAIDHIHPWSKGGSDCNSNLQVLCIRCNSSKRNKIDWSGRA